MNRLSIRTTGSIAVAAPLILALLARVPFADGLLLHDHSDHGVHSHTVTLDDLHEGDLRVAWHGRHDDLHDDDREDRNNDSDGGEYLEPLLIFVSASATVLAMPRSSGAATTTNHHLTSKR